MALVALHHTFPVGVCGVAQLKWRNKMYDSTLALTKIRDLINKITIAMASPNDNALYFTTGEYANDAFKVVQLVQELDEFLTNNDIELAPLWWTRSGLENYEIQNGTFSVD